MRTHFAGVEPLVLGFRDALAGGPAAEANLFVCMVHWDDFETRAFLLREARQRGTDLILLQMEKEGTPNTVTAANLTVSLHCILALGGRFKQRRCLPWVPGEQLTCLIPVDEGPDEIFYMEKDGQFAGVEGGPEGQTLEEGFVLAEKRLESCVQWRFHMMSEEDKTTFGPRSNRAGRKGSKKRR